jgi:hypothetical protein
MTNASVGKEQPGPTMVPFKYFDFWDVPRWIMLTYMGHLFWLASYFDDDRDDYDENYSIELLPNWVEQEIESSRSVNVLADAEGRRLLGKVPVKDIIFDSTKRKTLDPTFLDKYLTSLG